jgi:hypothetical protein
MSRLIASITFALVASAMAVNAQDTTVKSKTKSSGGQAQTVTYTGCVAAGTESRSFVLDKVVPVSRTTTTDLQTGESSSSTTYALVPGERVEVQTHVGKKVEVTGTMLPGGDSKTETTTRVDREHGDDAKTRTRVENKNAMPQFQVTSIRDIGPCN